MPTAPDFRLYHGNSLEVLAGLLSEELRAPAPGTPLLAPDTILIPQPAMRRWLQVVLAQAHGIAANLRFLTSGEFVREALAAHLPATDGDELDAASLHWRLHAALTDPAVLREPALAALRGYLDHADPLRPWSLAGELAQTFEKYQAWRRDWLLAWENGVAPNDAQAALWRHVARGRPYRARRIDDYLTRFGALEAPVPTHLPSRLFAFACLNVSPDVLRVIATQARAGVLHFYLPTPTRKYWGDLRTLAERLRTSEGGAFDGDAFNDAAFNAAAPDQENPLLQAWGAAGRDFMAVLGGYDVVHPSGEIPAYAQPRGDGLLQRLQRDLLDRKPAPATPWRAAVDRDDPSLQLHVCHTRQREIEVLHDQLRGLFEDARFDPPLQPREVAVLAPDIDLYAPAIAAVFGGAAGRDAMAYAMADNSPLAAEPLADVFLRLLALPLSRFGVHETLDLLATPAIAEQAGLDLATLDAMRGVLADAGARWGLDAAHRQQHEAPADDSYTWQFAIERLLLGAASGDQDMIGDIAPWPALEGSALDAFDILLRRVRLLQRYAEAFARAATPQAWSEQLLGMLETLLPARPAEVADQQTLARLREAIARFRGAADAAGYTQPIAPEIVRVHFRAELGQADTRAPLLGGGISFGRMVPMRLIPFRVICVLGMNDGDYPRRDPTAGLNRLTAELTTKQRRHGDRSLRDDDRFLFLQLFAAAADVFYLSYVGADPRDGSVREPSVLVSELLEVAARYHANPDDARAALQVRHTLQPFSPAAFGAAIDDDDAPEPRRFSYRGAWLPAIEDRSGSRHALTPWISAPLPAPERSNAVSLDALRGFLLDPPRAFLRQRLDLRQPDDSEAVDDNDPLLLPGRGLQRQRLQEAVFAVLLDCAPHLQMQDLHARLQASALLPSGPLGRQQLDALREEVTPYVDAFRQWRSGESETQAFELDIDGVRLHGQLDERYPRGLARMRFGALHGPSQIRHGLDWLVASALGDARPLLQFAEVDGSVGPHLRATIPRDQALSALRGLLALREEGLRTPLPFLSRAGGLWYADDSEGRSKGWYAARKQWHGDERAWGEATTPAAQLALRGHDPFSDDALAQRFRELTQTIFDAVIAGRAGSAS
ncbi:MAG: exodeoxyribonuclease V subunit gamma [Lysobacter sp.]|nr:exodeoxyribonuclease V subunit gamma [Lysobacter sp.]